MLNTLDEINKRIEIINELIPSFDTLERKEIKKNNKLIEELSKELNTYKEIIYNELTKKKDKELPTKDVSKIKNIEQEIQYLKKQLNYKNNNRITSKLELDKNIYDIINSKTLEGLHKNLKIIIDKFNLINISLNSEHFKCDITLYKYMIEFFKNINNPEFNKIMQNTYDALYWESPDIISHLILNIKELIDKHSKEFYNYIIDTSDKEEYNELLNRLMKLKQEKDTMIKTNMYLNYNLFLSKEILIENYLDNSNTKKEMISKFTNYDNYLKLSKDDKEYFYKEMRGLYHLINEYGSIVKYKVLIDKVVEILKDKDKYKNSLKELNSKILKLNKQKEKKNKKLFNIYKKLNKKKDNIKLNNKYNEIFNQINKDITEIINTYKEYNEVTFINDVITKLNENSTYYDILSIYTSNYNYLMEINKELDFNYDEFEEYIYNPYLVISKNVVLNNTLDIKLKLEEKYSMYNINFDLEENSLEELKESLKYLYNLSYYEETSLDLNKIKIIIELNKN